MTVAEHRLYSEKLQAELVSASAAPAGAAGTEGSGGAGADGAGPAHRGKGPGQILAEIRPGVTEKEIAARLQYLMLHFGGGGMSFDSIVASGPNGSMPHAVPRSER